MSDSTGGVLGPSTNWAPLLSSTESLDMGFRVQTAISEIREHFERQGPRLRFEDLAGKGAAGMVFRLVESDSRGPLPGSRGRVRRLALKRPLSVLHDDLVRTEIKWLQVRRAHCVSPWHVTPGKCPIYVDAKKRAREKERY